MMRRLGFVCSVVLGLAIGGCGDDPEDQCRDLLEAVCSKTAECGGAALGKDFKDQCLSQADQACENAKEPPDGVDVDECIDAVNDASCGDFDGDTLPSACGD